MYPVGLVNLKDPPDNSASSSHHNVAVAPQPDIIAVSEGDLPNISHLEGLDNSDNLLHAINPGLPSSTESPLNIFPGSDGSFSVFAEDGLFSTFEVQESVILWLVGLYVSDIVNTWQYMQKYAGVSLTNIQLMLW